MKTYFHKYIAFAIIIFVLALFFKLFKFPELPIYFIIVVSGIILINAALEHIVRSINHNIISYSKNNNVKIFFNLFWNISNSKSIKSNDADSLNSKKLNKSDEVIAFESIAKNIDSHVKVNNPNIIDQIGDSKLKQISARELIFENLTNIGSICLFIRILIDKKIIFNKNHQEDDDCFRRKLYIYINKKFSYSSDASSNKTLRNKYINTDYSIILVSWKNIINKSINFFENNSSFEEVNYYNYFKDGEWSISNKISQSQFNFLVESLIRIINENYEIKSKYNKDDVKKILNMITHENKIDLLITNRKQIH